MAAVFLDFRKNKCNFLHKNKLDIVRRVQFLTGRRPRRSFSPGTVAAIALWKSAPMLPVSLLAKSLMSLGVAVIPGTPLTNNNRTLFADELWLTKLQLL